jgi:light-regulated signal transduction histidine kinase (bacteriophytochrome)/ActR/RegA family two-component response regulator
VVTVDNCDREPIHIPGSIQPSGALVAFEPAVGSILHASTNLGRWLPVGYLPIKGRALSDLLGEPACERVTQALAGRAGGPVRHEVVDLPARPDAGQPQALEAVVHSHRGVCFVEVEPVAAAADAGDWLQGLSDTIDALRSATGLEDLFQRMAQRVKRLTRFDRVMVYSFDEDQHGHVVADAREPGMESFHDLHYPASDIPAQARQLYASNLVRYIADVGYTAVPVQPWLDTERLQPLDMSHAVLRSVSPMHIQYLQNMGVESTLTLSLLVDGRLWGLIACHHRLPTALPLRLRRACYALSVTAGYMTGWFASQRRIATAAAAAKAQVLIVEAFNQVQVPLSDVIEHCATPLLQMVGATSGALWRGDDVLPFGQWPAGARGESVLRFVRHAFETSVSQQIDTQRAELQPPLKAAELRQVCGVMAIKFDGFASSGLVWLRPEHRNEVLWGGDPDKPVELKLDADGRPVLAPRSSFARWTVLVKGTCRPWTDIDREAAASLAVVRQVLVVRESLAQISLSDRQFRSLVTLQSDAYWQTDRQARISTMSKPLPFDHPMLQATPLPDLFAAAGDCEGVTELRTKLAGQRPFRALRLTLRRPAEPPLTFLLSGEPLRDIGGQAIGWHGTLSDVTRDAQLEVAMQQAAVAELANLTKSKFLSQVSHELRTPLNAVLGFSQLVLMDPTTPAAQRTHIQHAHDAAQRLLAMITDLLDLSRIETGNLAVAMTPVDVRALLTEVRSELAADAAKMAVKIDLPAPAATAWVHADRARLHQVLVNLLSNAIKYNQRGGRARVTIAEAPDPDRLRITVEDSGEGLSPQQIEHLFEPFNRLGREGQNIGGSGIGLLITRQLVQFMGGRIEVESRPGAGSRFSVDLLRADIGAPAPVAAWPAAALPGAPRDALVLYIEDDPTNELLMRAIVEGLLGYRYAITPTAEEGLLLARTLQPAVMLVDLNLPGHDGVWLAEQIQDDAELAGISLISLTADATPRTRARLLAAGFKDCWIKPIDVQRVGLGLQLYAPGGPARRS